MWRSCVNFAMAVKVLLFMDPLNLWLRFYPQVHFGKIVILISWACYSLEKAY